MLGAVLLSTINLAYYQTLMAGLREAMTPYVTGGAYQNFVDPDLPDWRTAYYGANYPRLVEIKNRYDPDNLFQVNQNITPQDAKR